MPGRIEEQLSDALITACLNADTDAAAELTNNADRLELQSATEWLACFASALLRDNARLRGWSPEKLAAAWSKFLIMEAGK